MRTKACKQYRVCAQPNRWTFQIPAIRKFIYRHVGHLPESSIIIDPFSGTSIIANYRNDWARGGVRAEAYLQGLLDEEIQADAVIFDPPYSPRQIKECYESLGLSPTSKDTQNAALYKRAKLLLAELLKPEGIALSFGWNSTGFGNAWPRLETMLVNHGAAHNDTICVAQQKPWGL